jgi:hypothetical protein
VGVVAFVGMAMDCGSGPGRVPLEKPQWVCPVADTDTTAAISGISASGLDDAIHLRWIIGSDPDLVGYIVHRRSESDLIDKYYETLPLDYEQRNSPGQEIEFIDEGVAIGRMYHYVLFAYDSDSNRSHRSDTLSFGLVDKPVLVSPEHTHVVTTSTPVFTVGTQRLIAGVKSFVVFVATGENRDSLVWVSPRMAAPLSPRIPTSVTYGTNTGGTVKVEKLTPGRRYQWRVDMQGSSNEPAHLPCECVYDTSRCANTDSGQLRPGDVSFLGSRSRWRTFDVE